ncbi:MAG: PH domain-containing protein [Actinomycetaceae bacterium]|nr:PH domain-containing protein [Actinomycetaceae bacterium]
MNDQQPRLDAEVPSEIKPEQVPSDQQTLAAPFNPPRMGASRGGVDPFTPEGVKYNGVSPALVKVRVIALLISGTILALGFAIPAFLFTSWLWIPTALIVALYAWLLWLVPRQVRAIGYAEAESDLLIRKGIMFKNLTVVPYGRMQYVDVSEGPIARMFGIASVQLHTASATTDASIPGLPAAEASRLRTRLAERGEAEMAGL